MNLQMLSGAAEDKTLWTSLIHKYETDALLVKDIDKCVVLFYCVKSLHM